MPGLAPSTRASHPAASRQIVVVTGFWRNSSKFTVVLYEGSRTDTSADFDWQAGASWPAHNALTGWTDHHMNDDLSSPIEVSTLSDAGGLLRGPGKRLPYHQS